MKTKLLLSLFVSLCFVGQTQAADFVIADFEDKNVGDTYAMRAWSETDGNATIALDPTNEKNKVVNLITTNYDALLKMEVTLPAGRTLADYLTLNLDL